MIEKKLKTLKELDKKSKKLNSKDVKFAVVYCLFLSVVLAFIIKNIFIIPFSFLGLATFSGIYFYINNKQFKKNKELIVTKIKQIESTDDALFRVLFNKEENFDLMKELLSSSKVDKDEIEDLYVNLSKKDYKSIDVKKYVETYEYLLFLLQVKEKKSILEDIEDQIDEGVKKPFMKKLEQIRKLFKTTDIKDSDIRTSKDKKKKMVIKKL